MALIPCPECSHQISTAAVACPHCGFPVATVQPSGGFAPGPTPTSSAASISEETLWQARPTSLLLVGQILRTVAFLIVLAILNWAAQRYLLPSLPDLPPVLTRILTSSLVLLVLLALARLILVWVKIKTVKWKLTNQRMVVEAGILSRTLNNLDIRTVDDTKFRQSIIGRLLGFGTVVVISKDRTNPVLELPGVKEPRRIQELIRATAYQVSQGQLFMREA